MPVPRVRKSTDVPARFPPTGRTHGRRRVLRTRARGRLSLSAGRRPTNHGGWFQGCRARTRPDRVAGPRAEEGDDARTHEPPEDRGPFRAAESGRGAQRCSRHGGRRCPRRGTRGRTRQRVRRVSGGRAGRPPGPRAARGAHRAAGLRYGRDQRRGGRPAARALRPQRRRGAARQPAQDPPRVLLGAHPLDDRGGCGAVLRGGALDRPHHHPGDADAQRRHRVLARVPGSQRRGGAQGAAGGAGTGAA